MTLRTTTLVFVRHGETALNKAGQLRGRADPPLTETGDLQARAVAPDLAAASFVAIYTSPRIRARATAERIATASSLRVEVDPRLDDVDYGKWSGLTREQVRDENPTLYAEWLSRPELVRFPGGETIAEILFRVADLVSALRVRHEGARVVLVTHDAIIRLWLCSVLGAPLASMHKVRIDLTSVSTFEYTGDAATVANLNDTRHLDKARVRTGIVAG